LVDRATEDGRGQRPGRKISQMCISSWSVEQGRRKRRACSIASFDIEGRPIPESQCFTRHIPRLRSPVGFHRQVTVPVHGTGTRPLPAAGSPLSHLARWAAGEPRFVATFAGTRSRQALAPSSAGSEHTSLGHWAAFGIGSSLRAGTVHDRRPRRTRPSDTLTWVSGARANAEMCARRREGEPTGRRS
jgi:hypothetical protein